MAAGYGQRIGNASGGRLIRNDMLKWIAYTIVFGFAVHANNWAHAFGALTGAAFGYTVPPRVWNRPVLVPVRVVAKLVGVVATVGALAIIHAHAARSSVDERSRRSWSRSVSGSRTGCARCRPPGARGGTTAARSLRTV